MATTKAKTAAHTPDDRMTLTEHLAELRSRIIKSGLAVVVGAVVLFVLWDPWGSNFLRGPYTQVCEAHQSWDCKGGWLLQNPLAGFMTRTRVSAWGGLVVALPVVLWQIWRFVVPALHAKEKRYAAPFVVSSVLLFLAGGYVAWLVLPKSLEFLVAYAGPGQEVKLTADSYIRFLTLMVLAFGVSFLFPVLLVFLQLVGALSPRTLLRRWREATVGIVVAAAVITPGGDIPSLVGMAAPMLVFYYAAIGIGAVLTRKRRRAAAAAAE